jgi:nitrogen fixation NifU-like protein
MNRQPKIMNANELYREIILEEAAEPQNVGSLPNATHEHSETNASCGDQVTVQLELKRSDNAVNAGSAIIKNIAWQGNGCAISQASMSLLSEVVIGKSVSQVSELTAKTVLDLLGLEEINPGREKCMMLGLKAVQKALKSEKK